MGTPSFMAPEQAEGRLDAINERTDIYSLGSILYNILALRPPITGSSADAEVMERIKTGRITPPAQRVQDPRDTTVLLHCPDHQVPEALSAVAMQALARDNFLLVSVSTRCPLPPTRCRCLYRGLCTGS